MRIGHISYVYKPIVGGQEIYIDNLLDFFSSLGHQQRVYQAKKSGLVEDEGLKLIPVIKTLKRKPVYIYDLLLLSKVKDLLKEDLLVVHDAIYLWPVIWHKAITVSHCVRWDRPAETDGLYNALHKFSAKTAFKASKKYVANDSNFFRQMGVNLPPKEKMFEQILPGKWFIPNCVDTSFYKKTEPYSAFKDRNIILVPRRVTPDKGINLAIKAFFRFIEKYPDTELAICGELEDKSVYANKMKQLVTKLGLDDKVKFIGQLNRDIMPSVYSAAKMTLIPTRSEEGTALAALESMSCGTVTLSTNVGGLKDLPTRQCEPDEVRLADLMIQCYSKKELIAQEQQAEVQSGYNFDNFKQAWQQVINSK